MKKLLIIGLFAICAISLNAQVNTKHLLGNITANDLMAKNNVKTPNRGIVQNLGISSTQFFVRLAIAETAYEVPLGKGGGGQFFSATGIGVSLAGYGLENNVATEKFVINALVFTPNTDPALHGVSNALTIGVPIPKLNLPVINAGIRYEWKTKTAFLQTSVTLEF